MKAKELMIGDLVAVRHIGDEITYERVIAVDEYSIKFIDSDNTVARYSLAVVEPIPLTEEILEANGFKKYDIGYYHDDIDFSVTFHFDKTSVYSIYDNPAFNCKYFHELQHALRLCGLNDLADNFKLKAKEE